MLRRLIYPKEVTEQEARRLAEPAALATIILSLLLMLSGVDSIISGHGDIAPFVMGVSGIVYAMVLFYVIMPSPRRLQVYKWPIILTNAAAVILGMSWVRPDLQFIPQIIMVLISTITLLLWDKKSTYIFIVISGGVHLLFTFRANFLVDFIDHTSFFLIAVIMVETIQRLNGENNRRIVRLQAINDFARQVTASIESTEVVTLIGQALMKAIQADSYYFGLIEGDQINMKLLFDEGEFFPPIVAPLEGTLTGWVVRNQQSLFIADLRNDVELEGVRLVLIGKEKTSLCWMGVPMRAGYINGIFAVASYKPNDFNRTDLELLENLAQQAGLALDNAYHHAEVESQSHLDSLTGVYNHGYILHILNNQIQHCQENQQKLTLVMLDIDYFKQYNDNYGHTVGDQVLTVLTQAIRQHIKSEDAVGRWGGEEFTVVLPGADGLQTQQIAERIQKTASSLSIRDKEGKILPFPTVSQGFAVFPDEAKDIDHLIDLADKRLYVAKERGRNQIEPKPEHWL